MNDQTPNRPRLGEIGLMNFAPYLMNRIMGRYNAGFRDEDGGNGPDHAEGPRLGGAVGGRRPADPRAFGLYRDRTIDA